jgi:hypothetical protein
MSIIHRLVDIEGDSQSQFHRVPLLLDAMLFDASRWGLISDGIDQVPIITKPCTYIVSFFSNSPNDGDPANGGRVIAMQHRGADWNPFFTLERASFNHFFAPDICTSGLAFFSNRKTSIISRDQVFQKRAIWIHSFSSSDTPSDFKMIMQGRRNESFTPASITPNTIERRIGLGSYPVRANGQPHRATNSFIGYIRSIEWLIGRELTDEQLRRVFNFGTAYEAGLITPQDISLDLSGVNGSAPVGVRPGSRQITFTPYFNSTADPAGTNCIYANFNSL